MLDDILRQPAVLAKLIARRAEFSDFGAERLRPGPAGRTYLVGSGDGWFAAQALAPHAMPDARATGRPTLGFLVEDVPKLGSEDRVLLISMSGDVDRTFEAAKAALSQGAGVSLLTNGEGGRVGALGVPKISLDLPGLAPFLCGTASYTATLAALALLVSDSDFPEEVPDILSAVTEGALGVVTGWPLNPPGLRYLAVGSWLATADYGAAKIVEVGSAPVWTDDLEEFAHRQFWTFSPAEFVVFLSLDELTAHYADAAAEALGEFGVRTAAISAADAEVRNASCAINLPAAPPFLFPFLAAIPLQIYAYLHGFGSGLDPNRRLHLKEDKERFATSRKLTRRSLLGTGR